MADYDTISKTQARAHPMDFVYNYVDFGGSEVIYVGLVIPEQLTIEMHQADMLIKVLVDGEEVLIHFEFQTTDSYDPKMPLRMAGYIIRAVETYRVPVYSSVIYLRPDAGRRDPGHYFQDRAKHKIFIEYQVFRLIDMDGSRILAAKPVGLLPFTPLMGRPRGVDSDEWLRRCVQAADSVEVPNKPAYLGSLAVLSNLIYDPATISTIILEETMQQPSIIEYWTEQATAQGVAQGETRAKRAAVLKLLRSRFGDVPEPLVTQINTIQDPAALDTLFDEALEAEAIDNIDPS